MKPTWEVLQQTEKMKQYAGKITLQLTTAEGSHLSLKNWIPTSVGQKTQASIKSCESHLSHVFLPFTIDAEVSIDGCHLLPICTSTEFHSFFQIPLENEKRELGLQEQHWETLFQSQLFNYLGDESVAECVRCLWKKKNKKPRGDKQEKMRSMSLCDSSLVWLENDWQILICYLKH